MEQLRTLLQRNLVRALAAYGLAIWIALQVAQVVLPAVGLPPWTQTLIVVLALLGALPTAGVAWALDRKPLVTAEAAPEHLSIAVLPFVNFSANADNEYFSDGMSEELIDRLVKVRELRVAARTSSFAFKGSNADVAEIGRRLRVSHVLEGSVRRSADRLRVTAQLVEVASGFHLWSESYERELSDVFAVQDDISRSIVGALRITLMPVPATATSSRPLNLQAYDFYLQGRYLLNRRSAASIRNAIERFELAVACDGAYARAHAALAECYVTLGSGTYAVMPAAAALARARASAERAVALEPRLADAQIALGLAQMYAWDWRGAQSRLAQAISLDPGNAAAHHHYAWLAAVLGDFGRAMPAIDRAIELDPLSLQTRVARGRMLQFLGRPEQAIAEYRRIVAGDENFAGAHLALGLGLLQMDRGQEAAASLQRARELSDTPAVLGLLIYAHARSGQTARADALLAELLAAAAAHYISPVSIAGAYVGLGRFNDALWWYERAFDERSPGLLYLGVEPLLDPLRSEPGFQTLVDRMDLPKAQAPPLPPKSR